MKFFIFSIVFCLFSIQNFSQGTWIRKADFGGTPRRGATAISIGNKGYIASGYDGSGTKDFWEYDPGADLWTQKADFPVTSYGSLRNIFVINGKGYIYNYEYDPGLNIWTPKTPPPSTGGGRYSFGIGNYGYCGGGNSFHFGNPPYYSNYQEFYKYDPVNDIWTQMADGPYTSYAATFTVGNEGYVVGGLYANFPDDWYSNAVWAYNGVTNIWTMKGIFPGGIRRDAIGFGIDFPTTSRGYVGLGWDTSEIRHADFWEYNPNNNSWIQRSDFGGGIRTLAIGFSIGNKGYVGTGADSSWNYYNDFWEYTPDSTIGIDEIDNDIQVLINPNPANDIFTISLSSSLYFNSIEIYNSSGKRISTYEAVTKSLAINSNKYSKGIYFVKVQTEKGSIVKKLIIQ